jgi:hypothetical protein
LNNFIAVEDREYLVSFVGSKSRDFRQEMVEAMLNESSKVYICVCVCKCVDALCVSNRSKYIQTCNPTCIYKYISQVGFQSRALLWRGLEGSHVSVKVQFITERVWAIGKNAYI